MKVAIDARYVDTTDSEVLPSGGIGRYVHRLIGELLAVDPELHLRLIVPASNRRPIIDGSFGARVLEEKFDAVPQSLSTLVRFSRSVNLNGVDLLHCPANVLPFGLKLPAVSTIHDLMWLDEPKLCASFWGKRMITGNYYRAGITHAAQASAHVLTVSNTSQSAIVKRFPHLSDKVTVTYHGLDASFAPLPATEAEAVTSHIVAPGTAFTLCVGQGSPYKNHVRAVQAFAEAFANVPEMKLVLVRRFTRWDGEMKRILASPQLRGRVLSLPQITERELLGLYARARIFLFPSLCEGFGLPAVEAMACGAPVLTANFGAMAEVCGNAALGVDTRSLTAIVSGLRNLHRDEDLRSELIMKGKLRAREFSWRTCAERTLAAYRKALGISSP